MSTVAFPVVIAAPSGAGKTSLARALVEKRDELVFALSATTRAARPGEQHDVDYHFVDDAGFDALIARDELLEWADVHGRRYGTLRRGVEDALARRSIVMLDIDVQGARRVRASMPDAVLIFVLPPSVAEMERRLLTRGSEKDDELATRMRTARAELEAVGEFDYVVVNDVFEETLARLEAIITAECGRVQRQPRLESTLDALRADIDEIIRRSQ